MVIGLVVGLEIIGAGPDFGEGFTILSIGRP
jgi:hypothetical protein